VAAVRHYGLDYEALKDLSRNCLEYSFAGGESLYVRGDYRQLRNAVAFLKSEGVTLRTLPPELFPGIDYCAFAIDPDGYALQLYYYMEQIGWDGKPRPAHLRPRIDNANWPETVPLATDTFNGEVYLGPWA